MPESNPVNPAEPGFEVRTQFVRGRNAVVAKADFGDLYVDYYLHLAAHKIKPSTADDAIFKRALAAFTLHCASRPWNEMTAWTINLQDPLVNLFLVGDNDGGTIAGRVFEENVKQMPSNVFYADVVKPAEPKRRSAIEFTGSDPLVAVEKFYSQSEQRMARYFQTGEEEFTMVTEHPDSDLNWLKSLTTEQAQNLEKEETLSLLERRVYRWHCGCTQDRMMDILAPAMRHDANELFGENEKIEIRCPRCGGRYSISREAMEAHLARGAA